MSGAVVVAMSALAFMAVPAGAHVTVDPSSAEQGAYQSFTFRVPNETDDSDTVQLRVQLPHDHPLASVSVQPKPGWTNTVKKTTLAKALTVHGNKLSEAVSEITWSGGVIKPGEFDTFAISVGPLPTDTSQFTFKALQGYRSPTGESSEVAWIQTAKPGSGEPEHPAPSVLLTTPGNSTPVAVDVVDKTVRPVATSKSYASTTVGVVGVALGSVAVVLAIAALGFSLGKKRSADDPTR